MNRPWLWLAMAALLAVPAVAQPQAPGAATEPIPWITDFEQGVALAKRTGRPILLDFWCGT